MPYFYFDSTYLMFMIPALIVSLLAQIGINSTTRKYSKIRNSRQLTGAQAAQFVLEKNGVYGVNIVSTAGQLTDHFDPRNNTIRLSENVYSATSVAAVGIAAHEAGHAVQHAKGYVPNKIRSFLVPVTNIGTKLGLILTFAGLILPTQFTAVLYVGIILYSLSFVFTLVTLPVEFNASRRAVQTISSASLLPEPEEYKGAKRVLTAAAMTYVAATFSSLMNILRLITLANRRR